VSHKKRNLIKVIFSDSQLPVKECEVSMLDIRQVVVIVLFLINGLWKIIRSGCVGDTPIGIGKGSNVEDTQVWIQVHVPAIDLSSNGLPRM